MRDFIYRARCALARFMYGRNGVDQLTWAMIFMEVLLSVLSSVFRGGALSMILYYLGLALWGVTLFRIFSRNLTKRRSENAKFMAWLAPRMNDLNGAKARKADVSHKYVRCRCGTYCRLPRGVGKVEMTCPKCGKKRMVKT